MKNKTFKITYSVFLYLFALIGLVTFFAFIAIELHLTNTAGVVDSTNRYLLSSQKTAWEQGEEWATLKQAILANQDDINKAASTTGISSRLIVAELTVEQLRLYSSDREIFKQIFQPLNILGVQSQFSWGVMGIKQDTAIQIENNLKDPTSPYYLGSAYEHLLDYPATTTDPNNGAARFARLTTDHDPYYSFLYGALFIKEVEVQWKNVGFDISNRPEILSTLYNIGFAHSIPNPNPQVGGAEIMIDGETYSFGELAYAFYNSDELLNEFPK